MLEEIAHYVSARNRRRKYKIFEKYFALDKNISILDIGFSEEEYSKNDNFIEKNYPYPQNITALGVDKPTKFLLRYPLCKVVSYEGKHFPFKDKQFDIGWSNAVLEHVGTYEEQQFFLAEILRTCNKVFITTPNKYFPVEVHTRIPFLHFLPKKWFDIFLMHIGKNWATGNYMNLLSKREIKHLLKKIGTDNYLILQNRLLGLVLDFVIIINHD
jgi:SAM-dependent methyltransferase